MSTGAVSPQLKYPAFRDLTPAAQAAAAWLRSLARALKSCRLYLSDNPIVLQITEQLHQQLNSHLEAHGAWRLRIPPIEIWLVDEPVVHPTVRTENPPFPGKEEELPFLFYRDGMRSLTFLPENSAHDFSAFFDALV